jgi:hypothetical protein
MIVVTGPGRGGTSFISRLYTALGFDTGGEWFESTNSGGEHPDVVRANGAIIQDLRLSVMASKEAGERVRRDAPDLVGDAPSSRLLSRLRSARDAAALWMLGRGAEQLELVPWERYDAVAASHAPRLLEIAKAHDVVKDPRFCWTLDAWARAGAPIEHVLLCVRNVDAMVESRIKAGHILFKSRGTARNSFIYGIGLCLTALHDHRIPYGIIQFPDFLDDPARLYDTMRFPRPIDRSAFDAAFESLARPDLVHDRR